MKFIITGTGYAEKITKNTSDQSYSLDMDLTFEDCNLAPNKKYFSETRVKIRISEETYNKILEEMKKADASHTSHASLYINGGLELKIREFKVSC